MIYLFWYLKYWIKSLLWVKVLYDEDHWQQCYASLYEHIVPGIGEGSCFKTLWLQDYKTVVSSNKTT